MKRLPNENKYQLDIKDQFKNEFEVGQLQGNNFHMTDSADLPMYIEPQGNIEQVVIEAVEGIVVEGSNINVNDVDTDYENSIMPQGNIEQDTREGYNLLNIYQPGITPGYSITIKGISFTYRADGGIDIVGISADKDAYWDLYISENVRIGNVKEKYDLVLKGNTSNSGLDCQWYDRIGNVWSNNSTGQLHTTHIVDENATGTLIRIIIPTAGTTINITVYPMIYSGDYDSTKPFEQYGSMPSLAFPSEVKGVSGHYDTVVENKNRFNINTCIRDKTLSQTDGKTLSDLPDIVISDYIGVIPNKSYPISNKNTNLAIRLFYYDKYKNYISNEVRKVTGNSEIISMANNVYFVRVQGNTTFLDNEFQFEEGTVATEYTPHQEQLLPIDISKEIFDKDNANIIKKYIDRTGKVIESDNARSILLPCKPNTTYTILKSNEITKDFVAGTFATTPNDNDTATKFVSAYDLTQATITSGANDTILMIYLCWNTTNIARLDEILSTVSIREHTPMYSGKPYKLNGKWYRPIEYKKEFLGGKLITKTITNTTGKYRFGFNLENAYRADNAREKYAGYCNLLKQGTRDDTYSLIPCISNVPASSETYGTGGIIYIEEISQMTLEQANAYVTEKGMYVVYKLAEPYVEEITDTTLISQLEAFNTAELYDGVTNINSYPSSEDVADMPLSVRYNFITPSPSIDRPSEVLQVGSDEEINYYHIGDVEETTENGITYSIKNGRFKANGTATKSFTIATKNERFDLESDRYTLGGKVISGTYSGIVGKYVTQDGGTNVIDGNLIDAVGKKNVTEKVINVYASIYVNNGVVFNNFEADLMLVKGDYIKETLPLFTPPGYCRYETVVENKNIYNANIGVEKGYLNSADGTVITGSGWKVSDYIKIPDNVDVITLLNGWGKGEVHCFYDKNKKFVDAIGITSSFINTKKIIKDNCKYVRFTVSDIYKEDFMIAFGDTDTFIEHQEQLFPIDLPIGKVLYNEKPVVELTDAEIEELGLEKAELYFKDEWKKKVFNGTENWTYYEPSKVFFDYNIVSDSKKVNTYPYCNYLKGGGYGNKSGTIMINNAQRVHISLWEFTTVAELKSYLQELYANGTPLYMVYELETPIYTPIKDENFIKQYRALQKAFSYYPVTNVNSYKPTVNVADLKLYVEYFKSNKITNK